MDDEPEQEALFEIDGPDGDGFVWIQSGELHLNLGPKDKVAEKWADWLGKMDFGERQ